jgi:hypothetical protein
MLQARISPPPTTIRGYGEAGQRPQAKSRIDNPTPKARKTTLCARAFIDRDRHHPVSAPFILLLAPLVFYHGCAN